MSVEQAVQRLVETLVPESQRGEYYDLLEVEHENPDAPRPVVEGASSDYDDLSVNELRAELRDRDLSTSGTKDELVARLQEDDAA